MFIIYHYLRLKCKIFCKSLAFFLKILYLCVQKHAILLTLGYSNKFDCSRLLCRSRSSPS